MEISIEVFHVWLRRRWRFGVARTLKPSVAVQLHIRQSKVISGNFYMDCLSVEQQFHMPQFGSGSVVVCMTYLWYRPNSLAFILFGKSITSSASQASSFANEHFLGQEINS